MRSVAWVPFAAMLISLEFTLALWRRWRQSRRSYLRSWVISTACITIGSAALWYGVAFGWSSPTFRVFYLFGAFLAPPWLAQGELELLIRPKWARISLVFLVLITVNMAFLIGAVPFVDEQVVSGFEIPHGKELLPTYLRAIIGVGNGVGTLVVIGGTIWSGLRSRGRGPAAASRFRGTLLIALGVAILGAGGGLSYIDPENSIALSIVVGIAIMYAGFVVASRRPGAHRAARIRRRDRSRAETVEPGHLLDNDGDAAVGSDGSALVGAG